MSLQNTLLEAFDADDFEETVDRIVALSNSISQYPELTNLNKALKLLKKQTLQAKDKWGASDWMSLPWGRRKTLARYASALDDLRETLITGIRSLRRTLDNFSDDLDQSSPLDAQTKVNSQISKIRKGFYHDLAKSDTALDKLKSLVNMSDTFSSTVSPEAITRDLFKLSYQQLSHLGNDVAKGTATRQDKPTYGEDPQHQIQQNSAEDVPPPVADNEKQPETSADHQQSSETEPPETDTADEQKPNPVPGGSEENERLASPPDEGGEEDKSQETAPEDAPRPEDTKMSRRISAKETANDFFSEVYSKEDDIKRARESGESMKDQIGRAHV